jgi:hypothetical protein
MKYQLRKASHADLVPLMRIGHEGIRPYVESLSVWDSQEQERRFREDFHPEQISVIQFEDNIVGYLKVEDKGDHLLLAGIYLSKSVRSVGLGSSIIADLAWSAHGPSGPRADQARERPDGVRKSRPAGAIWSPLVARHSVVASGEGAMLKIGPDGRFSTVISRTRRDPGRYKG